MEVFRHDGCALDSCSRAAVDDSKYCSVHRSLSARIFNIVWWRDMGFWRGLFSRSKPKPTLDAEVLNAEMSNAKRIADKIVNQGTTEGLASIRSGEKLEELKERFNSNRDFAEVTVSRNGENLKSWTPSLSEFEIMVAVYIARLIVESETNQNSNALSFDALVLELIAIGRETRLPGPNASAFHREDCPLEFGHDPRARETGEILYRMGGNKVKLMQQAYELVAREIGPEARGLSACWHEIGLEEWKRSPGSAECWLH